MYAHWVRVWLFFFSLGLTLGIVAGIFWPEKSGAIWAVEFVAMSAMIATALICRYYVNTGGIPEEMEVMMMLGAFVSIIAFVIPFTLAFWLIHGEE